MSLNSEKYDVAIVGGGPAGSSLAIRLSMAGRSVVLVEKKKFPREKLCGEFISPECRRHFADLGVLPEITVAGGTDLIETIFFSRRGKGVSVPSEWFGDAGTVALGLSRAELDARLLERARECGAYVYEETTATQLIYDERRIGGIRLKERDGRQNTILSRLTVDATGRNRSIARHVTLTTSKKRPASLVAFKTHLRGVNIKPGTCEIYAYRGGYGGCNRVENDLYDLCFIASAADTKRLGSNAERVMREIVFSNKRAYEAMHSSTVAKPWLAVPIERFGRGELVPAPGLITVGDAAAFIDPFTGSGILLALESSAIAAESILKNALDPQKVEAAYRANYSAAFERRLQVCSMLRHAAFVPFLTDAMISLLGISRVMRRRVVRATRFSGGLGV